MCLHHTGEADAALENQRWLLELAPLLDPDAERERLFTTLAVCEMREDRVRVCMALLRASCRGLAGCCCCNSLHSILCVVMGVARVRGSPAGDHASLCEWCACARAWQCADTWFAIVSVRAAAGPALSPFAAHLHLLSVDACCVAREGVLPPCYRFFLMMFVAFRAPRSRRSPQLPLWNIEDESKKHFAWRKTLWWPANRECGARVHSTWLHWRAVFPSCCAHRRVFLLPCFFVVCCLSWTGTCPHSCHMLSVTGSRSLR